MQLQDDVAILEGYLLHPQQHEGLQFGSKTEEGATTRLQLLAFSGSTRQRCLEHHIQSSLDPHYCQRIRHLFIYVYPSFIHGRFPAAAAMPPP